MLIKGLIVLLFRMASGLVQIASGALASLELISATIADGR
jgi:hypothetical protein